MGPLQGKGTFDIITIEILFSAIVVDVSIVPLGCGGRCLPGIGLELVVVVNLFFVLTLVPGTRVQAVVGTKHTVYLYDKQTVMIGFVNHLTRWLANFPLPSLQPVHERNTLPSPQQASKS